MGTAAAFWFQEGSWTRDFPGIIVGREFPWFSQAKKPPLRRTSNDLHRFWFFTPWEELQPQACEFPYHLIKCRESGIYIDETEKQVRELHLRVRLMNPSSGRKSLILKKVKPFIQDLKALGDLDLMNEYHSQGRTLPSPRAKSLHRLGIYKFASPRKQVQQGACWLSLQMNQPGTD